MKNLIKLVCKKIYEVGYHAYQADSKGKREIELKNNATIGTGSYISDSAIIQNSTGDCNRIVIGNETNIMGYLLVYKHGGQIDIGNHCWIAADAKVWSAKKISIGNRVLIAHNVNITDNIAHPIDTKLRHLDILHIRQKGFQEKVDLNEKEIIIEDDVWIGFNSIILKGVRIGKGAIIGAGTIINKDVPDYAIMVGNPARIVRYNK